MGKATAVLNCPIPRERLHRRCESQGRADSEGASRTRDLVHAASVGHALSRRQNSARHGGCLWSPHAHQHQAAAIAGKGRIGSGVVGSLREDFDCKTIEAGCCISLKIDSSRRLLSLIDLSLSLDRGGNLNFRAGDDTRVIAPRLESKCELRRLQGWDVGGRCPMG